MPSSRERILHLLKTKGPLTAAALARRLGMTAVAARQHLLPLEAEGLVAYDERPAGVGRPARVWRLTEKATALFPDSHGELAVAMLGSMREAFGEKGLERLVALRTRAQIRAYRERVSPRAPLHRKVAELAALRREEGYMAEWSRDGKGFLLVENHCPICAAARTCQGLCAGELDLFRKVLGARVERTEHILAGARRCTYRISPRGTMRTPQSAP
ncbi:MAG: transcriptional regulator [Planctomycetes bacterium]|nr:transcriptional regulator [Planctomycetota bacterium]